MADNELDAFLGAGSEPAPAPEPQQAPPEQAPEPQHEPDEGEGDAAEQREADDAPAALEAKNNRTVPFATLEKVRHENQRQDRRLP